MKWSRRSFSVASTEELKCRIIDSVAAVACLSPAPQGQDAGKRWLLVEPKAVCQSPPQPELGSRQLCRPACTRLSEHGPGVQLGRCWALKFVWAERPSRFSPRYTTCVWLRRQRRPSRCPRRRRCVWLVFSCEECTGALQETLAGIPWAGRATLSCPPNCLRLRGSDVTQEMCCSGASS